MQPERTYHGDKYAGHRRGDCCPGAIWLHAERHRTCRARAGEPRSTPERACFTTSSDVTRTSVACEVKLYLAVPSPLLSRPPLLGPVSGPSSFCHRTRSGSAAGSPRGAIQVHAEHSVLIRSGHGPTAPPSRLRYCQRTRRGPADGPPRALIHPPTTASAPRELRGGRTREGPSAAERTRALRDHHALVPILRDDCRVQPPLQVLFIERPAGPC